MLLSPTSVLSVIPWPCVLTNGFFFLTALSENNHRYAYVWASVVAQLLKNLPAMQETRVGSLGWEDSLEEGMATRCRILAWRIPWTEEPGGLQSMVSKRGGHD